MRGEGRQGGDISNDNKITKMDSIRSNSCQRDLVAKQDYHFRQFLMRKDIIEKVILRPSLEGDEGARPRHLGKNVSDTGLAL